MKSFVFLMLLFLPLISQSSVEQLLENSISTKKAFDQFTFSWTAIHGDKDRNHFEVDAIHSPGKSKLDFYMVIEKERRLLSSTYIVDGFWYVTEAGKKFKYRPYEAHYNLPTTYYYLMKSKVQFLTERNIKFLGIFKQEINGRHQFFRKMTDPEKEAIRKRVDLLKDKLIPQSETRAEESFYLREAQRLFQYVKEGKKNEVHSKSGIISRLDMADGVVTIENFQWITVPDEKALTPPLGFKDLTKPADLTKSILISYNHNWEPGMLNFQTDGRILNPVSDELRRIPFKGAVCTPFAIDKARNLVYVTGIPVNSNDVVPFVINMSNGKNSPIGGPTFMRGQTTSMALSPNGKMLALLHNAAPSLSKKSKLVLINLETRRIERIMLKDNPQKVIWHPDGKSLFVSLFNFETKTSIISRVTPGKLSDDVILGANPVVLPVTNKLLHLDLSDQLWKLSDLNGEKQHRFREGLLHLQYPCPDEKENRMLMIHRNEEGYSIPVVYDLEKGTYKPLTGRKGLWLNPVWCQ